MKKKDLGQYFTKQDVWLKGQVEDFIIKSKPEVIVDPFCGGGDLLRVAKDLGFENCKGYDIDEKLGWLQNDSLLHIPTEENSLILTNPPYLAKNSAKRRNATTYEYFKTNPESDLYLIALKQILSATENAVVIIPESYIQTGLFFERLNSITVIEDNPFYDTECPVCVACFDGFEKEANKVEIFKNSKCLFTLEELMSLKKTPKNNIAITFNAKEGQVGIRCIDGVKENKNIGYNTPQGLDYDINKIGHSSRSITTVEIDTDKSTSVIIDTANDILRDYRHDTADLLMCPFKGNNANNIRRRRLDFATARAIIEEAVVSV